MDSSSAILLHKIGWFGRVTDVYRVMMATSVFCEVTMDGYAGSQAFRRYRGQKRLRVLDPDPVSARHSSDFTYRRLSGAGERDTLQLYRQGIGDFVIVDDRAAAVTCRDIAIPHMNALLVPRVLYMAGRCSHDSFRRGTDAVISIGRYSDHVLRTAKSLSDEAFQAFLP